MITRFEHKDLTPHNTFGMKVSCALWLEYDKADDLKGLDLSALPQPVFHIGSGSNLLFTKDFPGTILHSAIRYVKFVDMGLDQVLMTVGAGVEFDGFVQRACEAGLWGAENLSLIPGEVGAAAVQNIGAYGVEAGDIISGVVCFDTRTGEKTVFKQAECAYSYRDSIFKQPEQKGRYIVTGVLFRLSRKPNPRLGYGGLQAALEGAPEPLTPQAVRDAVIAIRRAKLPDPAELGSAGSFFKNPVMGREQFSHILSVAGGAEVPHYDLPGGMVKVPAAWMIEQCGFKGQTRGGAGVYGKQPLVLVNASGSASPDEVTGLMREIIDAVFARYGVTLHTEVEII